MTGLAAFTVRVAVLEVPLALAVMVAEVFAFEDVVVTLNVALVAPPGTETVAGTTATELLDDNATENPPDGAALPSVTVPTEPDPAVTVVGLNARADTIGGVTANIPEVDVPFTEAVMVTFAAEATGEVLTVNVPLVAPAAIVTELDTVADALFDESATDKPVEGAGLLIVTVPVEGDPPTTEVGLTDKPVTFGAVIVSGPLAELPLEEAVMVAVTFAPTATVVTVKVPEVAPAAIAAVAGAVAAELLEDRGTLRPPEGAAELIVTVPVEFAPPTKLAGFMLTAVTVGPLTVRVAVPVEPFALAVIVAAVFAATATVVIENVPEVAPPAIDIVAGTVTEVWLEEREIVSPPLGAGLEIVTVPVEGEPPTRAVGLTDTAVIVGPLMLSAALALVWPTAAEMFATVLVEITDVVTLTVAVLCPAPMVTELEPTCAAALSEAIATVVPPEGALPERVIVAVEGEPPKTLVGDKVTDDGTGGRTGSAHGYVKPKADAVRLAVTLLDTG